MRFSQQVCSGVVGPCLRSLERLRCASTAGAMKGSWVIRLWNMPPLAHMLLFIDAGNLTCASTPPRAHHCTYQGWGVSPARKGIATLDMVRSLHIGWHQKKHHNMFLILLAKLQVDHFSGGTYKVHHEGIRYTSLHHSSPFLVDHQWSLHHSWVSYITPFLSLIDSESRSYILIQYL